MDLGKPFEIFYVYWKAFEIEKPALGKLIISKFLTLLTYFSS